MARDLHPDDDGRTIADMSGVGGPAPEPLSQGSRDVREELGGTEEQLMVLLGTLKAGLSIGAVYIVVFGIAIAIMVALWT